MRPGSRAGSAQGHTANTQATTLPVMFSNVPGSPLSSISGTMFPEDVNTSGSWDLTHTVMQKLQTSQDIKINYHTQVMDLHNLTQIKDYNLLHRLTSTKTSELCTTKTSLLQTQWEED